MINSFSGRVFIQSGQDFAHKLNFDGRELILLRAEKQQGDGGNSS